MAVSQMSIIFTVLIILIYYKFIKCINAKSYHGMLFVDFIITVTKILIMWPLGYFQNPHLCWEENEFETPLQMT